MHSAVELVALVLIDSHSHGNSAHLNWAPKPPTEHVWAPDWLDTASEIGRVQFDCRKSNPMAFKINSNLLFFYILVKSNQMW